MAKGRSWLVAWTCLAALAGCCGYPAQHAAAPKQSSDCTPPSLNGALPLPAFPTAQPVTGGTFLAAGPVTIGIGQKFDLTSDLVIASNDEILIDGDIDLPIGVPAGAAGVNL